MNHSQLSQTLIAIIALCSMLAVPVVSTGAAQTGSNAYVTVGNISISQDTPEPGERVTIRAEFRNSGSSSSAIKITEASLRQGGSLLDTANDLGSLGAGDSTEIPFATTFDSEGEKKLTIIFRGTTSSGGISVVKKPVYVEVEPSSDVTLAVSKVYDTDVAVGAETPVNVTVANGNTEAITGVQLELNGASVDNPNRITGSIDGGAEERFQYDVAFDTVGTQTLSGEVMYNTVGGDARRTTKDVNLEIVRPDVRADVSAHTLSNGDTEVVLTNFGNTEFSDVEITAAEGNDIVAQNLMADIAPDSNESVVFDIPSSVDGTVTYNATYTAAGTSHTTLLQDQSTVSGEIRLVSVETSQSSAGVTITGDAANLGSTTADSVLVRVTDTTGVSPTAPTGEYYVGEIEGSEFSTFELTAETESNTESIPVEVTYVVDGERVTATQEIDVEPTGSEDTPSNQGRSENDQGSPEGGLPLTVIGVVLALIVIGTVGFGVYRWRNS